MRVLWFTWRDRRHPLAGGAEIVNEELAKRLAGDGHEVRFLVGGFPDGVAHEWRDGLEIIRLGNRWTVYWRAYRYYRKHLVGWPSLVIDEVNTVPFFAKWYVRERNILFVHQLARDVWFSEIFFPLNVIGYVLEPLYLRFLSDRRVATVSESTKRDLMRCGFSAERIVVIPQGIAMTPIADPALVEKFPQPTMLAFGAIRPMKRTAHVVRAFEIAKRTLPSLQLVVAGDASSRYGRRVLRMIAASPHCADITVYGNVDDATKANLLQKSHVLCMASVKEGWGLVVSEAASQGTPAVVYDADGLRDSVRDGETGLLCEKNAPEAMAAQVVWLLSDPQKYAILRQNAWLAAKGLSFDDSYAAFSRFLAGVV